MLVCLVVSLDYLAIPVDFVIMRLLMHSLY